MASNGRKHQPRGQRRRKPVAFEASSSETTIESQDQREGEIPVLSEELLEGAQSGPETIELAKSEPTSEEIPTTELIPTFGESDAVVPNLPSEDSANASSVTAGAVPNPAPAQTPRLRVVLDNFRDTEVGKYFRNRYRRLSHGALITNVSLLAQNGEVAYEMQDGAAHVRMTREIVDRAAAQYLAYKAKQAPQPVGRSEHPEAAQQAGRQESNDHPQPQGSVNKIEAVRALIKAFEDLAFVKSHNSYMVQKGMLAKYEQALAGAKNAIEGNNPDFAAIKRIAEENGRGAEIAALENLEQDVHYLIAKASHLPLCDEKLQAAEIRKTFNTNHNVSKARNAFLDLRTGIKKVMKAAEKDHELDQASQELERAMQRASQPVPRKR